MVWIGRTLKIGMYGKVVAKCKFTECSGRVYYAEWYTMVSRSSTPYLG